MFTLNSNQQLLLTNRFHPYNCFNMTGSIRIDMTGYVIVLCTVASLQGIQENNTGLDPNTHQQSGTGASCLPSFIPLMLPKDPKRVSRTWKQCGLQHRGLHLLLAEVQFWIQATRKGTQNCNPKYTNPEVNLTEISRTFLNKYNQDWAVKVDPACLNA